MSDIFISYASADRDRARVLAEALTERGWKVWWDRTIPPGKEFDEVIEEALDASQCVIVLWSNTSVSSTWVKTEAAEAMRRKILVPALIDAVKIPLEFRRLQAADLSGWKGERSHEELQKFFESIEANVGHSGAAQAAPERAPAEAAPPEPPPVARTAAPPPRAGSNALKLGIAGIVTLVVALAGYTAYNEHAKRVAMEEKAEKVRRAAEDALRVAEEAAARARAAQEESARQAAQRKIEEQRRAAEDAARAARERAERERLAREKAEQERVAREKAERVRVEQERVAREKVTRLAEQQTRQKAASRPSSVKLGWHDHALRFTGVLTRSAGAGMLRATVWDLRTGERIGNYDVPVTVVKQGTSDYVVSGDFAIPGDSVTPTPHTHTSRLHLRSEQDGTVRFIQNCPRPGQCYPAK